MLSIGALVLAAAANISGVPSSAQASGEPIAALLSEVHALRVAMEQQASVGPRIQLTLARLTIEEQRVTHLSADLNGIRQQLAAADLALKKIQDDAAEIEARLPSESEPVRRRELEAAQRDVQNRLRLNSREQDQLRARENEAAQAVASEQSRWIELNSRLDELERLLAPIR
jgi:chromosome segregation ATPase